MRGLRAKADKLGGKLDRNVSLVNKAKKLVRDLKKENSEASVIKKAKKSLAVENALLWKSIKKLRVRAARAEVKIANKTREAHIQTTKRLRAIGLVPLGHNVWA